MRIFKDVGLVEQLGSGMSRILKAYDKSAFDISEMALLLYGAKRMTKIDIQQCQPMNSNDTVIKQFELTIFNKCTSQPPPDS